MNKRMNDRPDEREIKRKKDMMLTPYQSLDTTTATTSRSVPSSSSSSSSSSQWIRKDKMELVPTTAMTREGLQRRQQQHHHHQQQQQLEGENEVGCKGSKMIKLEKETSQTVDGPASSNDLVDGANDERRKRNDQWNFTVTEEDSVTVADPDTPTDDDAYLSSSSSSSTCKSCVSDDINIPNFRRVSGINANVNLFRSSAPESWLAAQIKKEQELHVEAKKQLHQPRQDATSSIPSTGSSSTTSTPSSGHFALHHIDWFIDLRFADGTEGGLCYKQDLDIMLNYSQNQSSSSSSSFSGTDSDTGTIHPITSTWLSKSTDGYGPNYPMFDPPILGQSNEKQQPKQKHRRHRPTKSDNNKRWYLTYLGDGTEEGKYSQTTAFDYMHRAWSSSTLADDGCSRTTTNKSSTDDKKRSGLQHLSERGLVGLNEVLLFHNMPMIRTVLQTLTLIWEQCGPETNVLMYCTLGKDRTGVVVALCQYLLGVSMEDIGKEYELSSQWYDFALLRLSEHFHGGIDPALLAGAPAHVMVEAFEMIRCRYGGKIDDYFDDIGFDIQWRKRFVAAAQGINK